MARFGVDHLAEQGRQFAVGVDATFDGQVGDVMVMHTSMCVRLYGPRGARNRVMCALADKRDPGEAA